MGYTGSWKNKSIILSLSYLIVNIYVGRLMLKNARYQTVYVKSSNLKQFYRYFIDQRDLTL